MCGKRSTRADAWAAEIKTQTCGVFATPWGEIMREKRREAAESPAAWVRIRMAGLGGLGVTGCLQALAQRNARLAELLKDASLHLKVVGVIGGAERTLVDAVYLARPVELLLNEVGIVGGHGKECRRVA